MIKKFNNYLLTHYPLLWNTKVVWMLIAALIMHLLFFLAGFFSIETGSLHRYYSLADVLSGSLVTFSVLCSLGMIIIWLVFYLRNNAFKNFYIIDKYYSTKEFFIILVLMALLITFFESYKWGACLKTRTLINKEQLVKEANIVNLARAFIPKSKSDYFKLSRCDSSGRPSVYYYENTNYFDTSSVFYNDSNYIAIRQALTEKDAFSYKNYCQNTIQLGDYPDFRPLFVWAAERDRWIDGHKTDSIKYILEACKSLCRKYGIEEQIDPEEMTRLVFVDSFHNITRTFTSRVYDSNINDWQMDYFDDGSMRRALTFIDACWLDSNDNNDSLSILTVEAYFALCFSILLLCYRLFSRRVFLISVVGSIVWSILFSLIVVATAGDNPGWFYLFLFGVFFIMSLVSLSNGGNKTITGALLNWQLFMSVFVILFIAGLIKDSFDKKYLTHAYTHPDIEKIYPVGYWVKNHIALISRLNLLLVILYVAFLFTRFSKKWHIQPEE